MANYKITIEKLNEEAQGENNVFECDEVLVIAMTPHEEGSGVMSSEFFSGNIDHLSTAMQDNGIMVASCRMAVAKHDSKEDMKREEMKRMLNDRELTAKILGAAVL